MVEHMAVRRDLGKGGERGVKEVEAGERGFLDED